MCAAFNIKMYVAIKMIYCLLCGVYECGRGVKYRKKWSFVRFLHFFTLFLLNACDNASTWARKLHLRVIRFLNRKKTTVNGTKITASAFI